MIAWPRLQHATLKTYDELYDELLKKGAQYHAKKEWRKAASAYREAIASKVDDSIV